MVFITQLRSGPISFTTAVSMTQYPSPERRRLFSSVVQSAEEAVPHTPALHLTSRQPEVWESGRSLKVTCAKFL
jgi:hypothetical protein